MTSKDEREFDRQFKVALRLAKEYGVYQTLRKYLLYKQTYREMRASFIRGCKQIYSNINMCRLLNHVWAFEPAYREFGYDYWERNIRNINEMIVSNSSKFKQVRRRLKKAAK